MKFSLITLFISLSLCASGMYGMRTYPSDVLVPESSEEETEPQAKRQRTPAGSENRTINESGPNVTGLSRDQMKKELFDFCHRGTKADFPRITALIQILGVFVTNTAAQSCLHHAAHFNNVAVAELLIRLGVSPFLRTAQGENPLEYIRYKYIRGADYTRMKQLLSSAMHPARVTQNGNGVRQPDNNGPAQALPAEIPQVSSQPHDERTAALAQSSSNKRKFIIKQNDKILVSAESSVQFNPSAHATHVPQSEQNSQSAQMASAGSSTARKQNAKRLPVHEAVEAGDIEALLLLLLRHRDSLNIRNRSGKTPLMLVFKNKDIAKRRALFDLLLRYPIDLNVRDRQGLTALHYSLTYATPDEYALELVRRGASVNLSDDHEVTPLMYAAVENRKLVIAELLKAGADPQLQDSNGSTYKAYFPLNMKDA